MSLGAIRSLGLRPKCPKYHMDILKRISIEKLNNEHQGAVNPKPVTFLILT